MFLKNDLLFEWTLVNTLLQEQLFTAFRKNKFPNFLFFTD